jgi:hypothetical protein
MPRFHRNSVINDEGKRVIEVVQFTPEEEARADAIASRVPVPDPPTSLELLTLRVEALERRINV